MKFYRVGGCVRDEILGRKSKDIDFTVEAPSFDALVQHIESIPDAKIFQIREEFLTVRALVPGLGAADYVMARKDGEYTDCRRPDQVFPGTIYDDLARRDFTMNAIAVNVNTGEHLDPHNGIEAIKRKLILCVGNPVDRFKEDALRILRALRFHVTLGFLLHDSVVDAIDDLGYLIETLPFDRVRQEVEKMFAKSTIDTMIVFNRFQKIRDIVFRDNTLWLMPTLQQK